MKLRFNTIYITYQGEVNIGGIGAPVIFLRLQGCPIRCYKRTMGILCDTPEALEKDDSTFRNVPEIVQDLVQIKNRTGISLICLTGGDPLWQDEEALKYLFSSLVATGFDVSVETSGVESINPYLNFENVTWVIDYKLKSAGIKRPFHKDNYLAPVKSIIKFVVADDEDFEEMCNIVESNVFQEGVHFTAGLFWGTKKLSYADLTAKLMERNLLGKIGINFQVHKMAEFYDKHTELATDTEIRKEI